MVHWLEAEKGQRLRLHNRVRTYIAAPKARDSNLLTSLHLQPPLSFCSHFSLYPYLSSHERAEPQHFR